MDSNLKAMLLEQGKRAKAAARILATASSNLKNEALMAMAEAWWIIPPQSWRPMPLIWTMAVNKD